MATQWGRTILQKLTAYKPKEWYSKDIKRFIREIVNVYGSRNEVLHGLADLAEGSSASNTTLNLDGAAGEILLNGVMMDLVALSDADCADNGVSGVVGPIGVDGAVLSYDSTSTYKVALIACNSDGDGALVSGDGSDANYCAIVSTTSDFPTSAQISSAISASAGNASGSDLSGCKWAHLAQISDANGTHTIALNRNNVLGA